MNKKITIITIIAMLINTTPVFAQDLPKLSTPQLKPLQTSTLSTTFKELRTNINKEGNLPDLPKLQTLPELDTSGFGKMESDFTKGTVDLTKEGYGKKVELPNPTLSASNKDTLFADINNQYASAKANLPSSSIPVDQIRSKLSNFDKNASAMYNGAVSNNASTVDGKKSLASAGVSAGDSAFQKALQGQFSLDNFEAPASSVPEWYYKPSSKITDRQAEISVEKDTIKEGNKKNAKLIDDGDAVLDLCYGIYVPPEKISKLNPEASAFLQQFNSIKNDVDKQSIENAQNLNANKQKQKVKTYNLNTSANTDFIDSITGMKDKVAQDKATPEYIKQRNTVATVNTVADLINPTSPTAIVKNILKLKNAL
ncbi:hypothetical protein IAI10_23060 [Clostridium sp. 19966]|uniref:hypothetical protein n=1 Tax=Clostridium sp. 19966 TaxID=2768166 RepID=UPI0028DFCFD0|nr:hypothetical protein [Clostridium sp. 19966]MDT8719529.1 hypothetical protein [Clostridium sp. 19966]